MVGQNFFSSEISFCVNDIAEKTGARLRGGEGREQIFSAAPIEMAKKGTVSFVENVKYLKYLRKTSASAVFCTESHATRAPDHLCVLIHSSPYEAYGRALCLLYPDAMRPLQITKENGISPAAHMEENVKCDQGVVIEAGCVIGSNVQIGAESRILAGSIIGSNVQIGRNCTIGPRVTVIHALIEDNVIIHSGVSIGQDGFGFAMGMDGHKKILQIGRVIIQSDVEIGANTTIDRGANRDTVIGEGSKIDNLVQIAHNVAIGKHCIIVGQVGISGSVSLEDFVIVAGQSGINGHITIGAGAQIGGRSAVSRDLKPGEKVMGYPAITGNLWMRKAAEIRKEEKKWCNKRRNR